jgi:hypothetical protein
MPVEIAAVHGRRDLVEVLFSRTKPVPSLPDWSVDGIIRTVNSPDIPLQACTQLFITSFQVIHMKLNA